MAEKKVTSYVCTVTEEQAEQLRLLLDGRGWKFSEQPYARWKAELEKTNVVAYNSGKLTVQGGGTEDFVTFLLEPEILHTFTFGYEEEPAEEAVDPHGGVDESGKGDFFGPLCIAGVYADEVTGPKLRAIGCCDSKLIKSSKKIMELSAGIREIAGNGWTAVVIGPESYNRLYAKFGNLNRLLAWGHARVIENLLEKVPACPRMLSDKFADERLIRRALLTRGREIRLDQRTKAESDVAVAAASILSREQFLRGMAKLEAEFGIELPRGAGPQVKAAGRSLMERFGASVFERCAKTHFKTWNELTGTPVEGGESW
ncbi:ribonuclease HIII [Victivallaceae bacterium BBE-744-WT-12]|uniref:Ribonuclease HIII n=1 Tax=Victivallis lenta TaxID=2606640 RepID=A0A844G060_9BACT|nr:ribonuclease HIII [Victivallis lenta]MST96051.1 ribonuclease HIII [Victivallis lenta]HBP05196.1 ribonuclease HIII [Lentisphaeria bacterium]